VVKGRKELSNIKGENACVALSKPASPNKIDEVYSCIYCGSLPDTTKLMRIKKVIG